MICRCGRDHSNQFNDYPEGSRIVVTGNFWGGIAITQYNPLQPANKAGRVLIPAGSYGRVVGHCDDGRVLVVFEAEDGKSLASHSFHVPETYFMIAIEADAGLA